MKILKISLIVIVSVVLIGGTGYLYASSGIKSKTGYADIITPRLNSADALLSINVEPGGVKPARWLLAKMADGANHKNPLPKRAIKSALKSLQGVQLRIYDARDKQDVFDSAIAENVAALKSRRWETLVTVRDDDEQIVVLRYGNDEQIEGLSIMASTPDKALFLNLIGPFDVEGISEQVEQVRW